MVAPQVNAQPIDAQAAWLGMQALLFQMFDGGNNVANMPAGPADPGVSPEQQYRMNSLATQIAQQAMIQQRGVLVGNGRVIILQNGGGVVFLNSGQPSGADAAGAPQNREGRSPDWPASMDLLELANGGALRGTLKQLDADKLEWSDPAAREPIILRSDIVTGIRFARFQAPPAAEKPTGWFQFQNGDQVLGDLKSLDRTAAEIESGFGGRLIAPRNALRSVAFGWDGLGILYEGPNEIDGWNTPSFGWTFQDGTFYGKTLAPLGRDLGLTGSTSVAFDLGWGGNLGLTFNLYSTTFNRLDYALSSYSFILIPGLVRVQRVQPGTGFVNLGDGRIPDMFGKHNVRVEVRTDTVKGIITILIDGKLVKEWQDELPSAPNGSGFVIQSLVADSSISISNMKVSRWGKAAPVAETRDKLTADQVAVYFGNRDEMKGQSPIVSDGMFKVSRAPVSLELPLSRVSQIVFPPEPESERTDMGRAIQAEVAGGNIVSFQLDHWSESKVAGRSQVFGPIALNPQSIRQLHFVSDRTVNEFADLDFSGNISASNFGPRNLTPAPQDLLLLKNGDRLRGTLEAIEPEKEVSWSAPGFLRLVNFVPGTVSAVQLGQRAIPTPSWADRWRVRLTTGDQFEGRIERVGPDKVALQTWYAGTLEFPRSRVQRLSRLPALSAPIFEGPTGLEGWTMGQITLVPDGGEWSYRDGAFYAGRAASIAKDIGLPDSARIEWDLNWSETMFLAVALYTDRVAPIDLEKKEATALLGGFYSLQIHNPSGNVKVVAVPRGSSNTVELGRVVVPSLIRATSGHFELLVSKPRGALSLLFDGNLVSEWVDTNAFAGAGTGIRFVHQGEGAIKLSGLRVSEWDGEIEKPLALSPVMEKDRLKSVSGEEITGEFLAFGEGGIRLRMADGQQTNAPLAQVRHLDFAGTKLNWENQTNITARGYFWNGDTVRFALEEWRGDLIKARSSSFDSATFRRGAFKRVELF